MIAVSSIIRSLHHRYSGGWTPRRATVLRFLLRRLTRVLEVVFLVRLLPAPPARPLNVPPKWRLDARSSGLARFVRTTPEPPITLKTLRAHYDRGERRIEAPHDPACVCEECYRQFAPPLTTLAFRLKVRRFFEKVLR